MANLLDEASILLTPTAYNNGSMLAVKPENGDGDFTFSRNSAATRVNAQGLVENVQILSSNLVSNGDFSQEGSELVTNGNFVTDSDWLLENGAVINNGSVNLLGNNSKFRQTPLISGKSYKLVYEVISTDGGSFRFQDGVTAFMDVPQTIGIHTYYFKSTGDRVQFQATSAIDARIDNVSVKEVGQDWNLGTGWSIGNGVAISDGSATGIQQNPLLTIDSTYQITATVAGNPSLLVFNSSSFYEPLSSRTLSNGTNVYILKAKSINFGITNAGADICDITNISVIEITNDTNLPRIDYTDGCGSWLLEPQSTNLITQSELFSNAAWTKKVNASITSNVVISPNGTLNSDTITWTTSGGTTQLYQVKNITGTSQSLSIFIKYISGSGTNFLFSIGSAVEKGINLTFTNNGAALTGVAGVDVTSYKIEDYENNWFRVSFTANYANSNCEFNLYRPLGTGTDVYAIYGAQLESSISYATSYIPTQGASSTRLRDIATNSGIGSLIGQTEGSVFFDLNTTLKNYSVISISDGTNANRVVFYFSAVSNQIASYITKSNVNSSTISSIVNSYPNSNYKVVIKYNSIGFYIFANGGLIGTIPSNYSFPNNTLNEIKLSSPDNSNFFEGKVKNITVYNQLLTDSEAIALTTI